MKLGLWILAAAMPCIALPVTSGTLNFAGSGNPTFSIAGDGWAATGTGYGPGIFGIRDCSPCAPGFILSLTINVSNTDFGVGTMTVGDVTTELPFNNVYASPGSYFRADGPAITITGPGVYTSTFTFDGNICGGFIAPGQPCQIRFGDLTGYGKVTVTIVPTGDFLRMETATYTFVPEGATWPLVLLGLVVAIGPRVYRRT